MDHLRIGLLGAAKIAKNALMSPAKDVPEVSVASVAARDPQRARAYATKHGIGRVHATYDDLISDPEVDAIYNPLPNGLHAEWTLKALAAGKHVLCEKPFTANAAEARVVAQAAKQSGLVVTEAFHYRYHPLAEKMRTIVHGGELGRITSISTALCFPLPKFSDIRYDYELAGGAMMDAGCYALSCLRMLGAGEPSVISASAKLRSPKVDRAMSADLRFADGCTGHLEASMWSRRLLKIGVHVTGERGELRAFNFVAPQYFNRLSVTADGRKRSERVAGEPTYTLQLRAFAGAVLRGEPNLTPPEDAILNMALIDDIYVAAGLFPRGT